MDKLRTLCPQCGEQAMSVTEDRLTIVCTHCKWVGFLDKDGMNPCEP